MGKPSISQSILNQTTPAEDIPPYTDVVIKVLSPERSIEIVNLFLDHYLPNRTKFDIEYVDGSDFDSEFETEDQMLQAYIEKKDLQQDFWYWNSMESDDNLSLGIDLTADGYLIFTMVLYANGITELEYFDSLRNLVNSKCGTMMYGGLPEFENGEDFIKRYAPQPAV